MKSGNVVIVYALKALQEIGALDDLPVVVAYTFLQRYFIETMASTGIKG